MAERGWLEDLLARLIQDPKSDISAPDPGKFLWKKQDLVQMDIPTEGVWWTFDRPWRGYGALVGFKVESSVSLRQPVLQIGYKGASKDDPGAGCFLASNSERKTWI